MSVNRLVEYGFFFALLGVVGYVVFQMLSPFLSALALAAIIVTICYPVYERILQYTPKQNETVAALVSSLFVIVVVFLPLVFIFSTVINEAVTIYNQANAGRTGFEASLATVQEQINLFLPDTTLDTNEIVRQSTSWLAGNLGAIFAGTASTVFLFFIALIGSFYLFRDGKDFTKQLVKISPLPDDQDERILARMGIAVRSVATGTVLVALIQGCLTAFGLWLFGFEQYVLWGTVAAIGALVPGVGTSIVFIPAILTLIFAGTYALAAGLAVWAMLAVGLIDNLLGPYLMSRTNPLHPFIVLLSVLGGISVFGPIGFVVGPVVVSLCKVLLELLAMHLSE